MRCSNFSEKKNLLSVFPSFQGRVPGAGGKKLDIHRGLQILPAGCYLAEPHINSSTHIYVCTHGQKLKSPVGWPKLERFRTCKQAPSAKPMGTERLASMPMGPGKKAQDIVLGLKGALLPVFAVALCLGSFLILCQILIT